MALSEKQKGELFVTLSGGIWAFFPVLVVLSYSYLPSLHSLAWSTLFAACTFAVILTYKKRWHELKSFELWKYSFLTALFIGVLFYGLFYIGLESTTPGNAAIIALFEVFTALVFFRIFRGETIPPAHIVGAVFMVVGAGIVLAQGFSNFHVGDLFVLAATFFTPLGNYYQQLARRIASSDAIMFLRSALSAPFLFVFAYFLYPHVAMSGVYASLMFLLINGVVLLGLSKVLWIEAIHRISVTKALALQSVVPLLTLFVAWAVLSQQPTLWQLISLVPFILGTLLLTDHVTLFRAKKAA